ncbi:hypothetical protein LXEBMM8_EKPBGFGD_02792 [Lactiplantibacillus xiangfangensis]
MNWFPHKVPHQQPLTKSRNFLIGFLNFVPNSLFVKHHLTLSAKGLLL